MIPELLSLLTYITALVGIFTDTGKFLQHFLRYQRSDVAHQRVSALRTGRHVGPTFRADDVTPGTLVYWTASWDSQTDRALQQVLQIIFLDEVIWPATSRQTKRFKEWP